MFHRMVGGRMEQNLEEFEDAREVVAALSEEYAAAESSDYVSGWPGWGVGGGIVKGGG
jgi:tubulin gamma